MKNTAPKKHSEQSDRPSGSSVRHGFVALLLGFAVCSVQAEISLDSNFVWDTQKPKKKEAEIKPDEVNNYIKRERKRRNGMSPMERAFEDGSTNPISEAINRDQIKEGFEPYSAGKINFFHMLWDGRTFYVAGIQYQSKEEIANIRKGIATKQDTRPVPGGGICTLFVYDENLKQAAKHDIKLNEADGKTWCNGANAVARVRGQDALLFSISYYLTDKPLAIKTQGIGDDWRYMTVLLRLQEQDGKVTIEQDESCLHNPNAYKDITSARKALARCER